jgi:hypothetical protein
MNQPLPNKISSSLINPDESQRASRYKRPASIPMRLTPRDEQIIKRCWEDKLLSTSELQQLFFGARARCIHRLRILYSNYYLDRYFLKALMPYHGSTEALYTSGVKGNSIVSLLSDQDQNYVALKRRELKASMQSPAFLLSFRHLRRVNYIRILFQQAFAKSNEWQQLLWIPERLLQDQFTINQDGLVRRVKIRPDGLLQYQHRPTGKVYSAFIEADLGTMSQKQMQVKIQRYLNYFQTPLPQSKYGTQWYRVLMITTSPKRATQLWRNINRLTQTIFWITSLEDMKHSHWLCRRIWLKAGQKGRYALTGNHQ